MPRQVTRTYAVLLAAWGVHVTVSGTVAPAGPDGARLTFSGPAAALPRQDVERLQAGFALAGPPPVVADVGSVVYPETDVQAEGLTVAMLRWTEAAADLPPRPVDVTFTAGRYRFAW